MRCDEKIDLAGESTSDHGCTIGREQLPGSALQIAEWGRFLALIVGHRRLQLGWASLEVTQTNPAAG